jgi:hypothetical protein
MTKQDELIESLKTELELTRQTHLAVVQRLQAEINKLKQEMRKDAEHAAWVSSEAAERDARTYNCGEL